MTVSESSRGYWIEILERKELSKCILFASELRNYGPDRSQTIHTLLFFLIELICLNILHCYHNLCIFIQGYVSFQESQMAFFVFSFIILRVWTNLLFHLCSFVRNTNKHVATIFQLILTSVPFRIQYKRYQGIFSYIRHANTMCGSGICGEKKTTKKLGHFTM